MRSLLLVLLLLSSPLFAQSPDVQQGPITFTGVSNGTPIFVAAGGSNGAVGWRLTYHVDGTSFTAAQVAIQGANAANAAGCTTASFSTITAVNADAVESTNPSVSAAQGNVAVKSFYPCIRMRVTAVTGSGGTVIASIAGWRGTFVFPQSFTFAPAGTQNVNVQQVAGTSTVQAGLNGTLAVGGAAAVGAAPTSDPIPQGSIDSAGNLITPDYCTLKAIIDKPGTGSTQLVAVSGGTTIRVCKWSFTTDTLTTVQLVTGTGATCTTPTVETGTYSGAGGGVFGVIEDYLPGPLITTAAKTLCISLSAGVVTSGAVTVIYSQR
jgi:hypothetical protein